MKWGKAFVMAGALVLGIGLVCPSNAMLFDGNVVHITWIEDTSIGTFITNYGNITVGSGVEIPFLVAGPLDISDTSIYLDSTTTGTFHNYDFNGIRIYDVNNTITDFGSVSIHSATNMAGFDSSRITFDTNNIWVNFRGLNHYPSTIVLLDVTPVPIPPTIYLMGSGLVGLIGIRRKMKKQ